MLNVLNKNLIVIKWQNVHVISKLNILRCIAKPVQPVTLHRAEEYSEPHQASTIEFFSKIINSIHLLSIFAEKPPS